MMKNNINLLKHIIETKPENERVYYDLLEDFGGPIINYSDYLNTSPINCDFELKNIDNADFNKCKALLTMILREDHFCCGTLYKRVENGEVNNILLRMLYVLENN